MKRINKSGGSGGWEETGAQKKNVQRKSCAHAMHASCVNEAALFLCTCVYTQVWVIRK